MHIIVCIDQNGGMRFNRRRQSRDAAVCARILQRAAGGRLWMCPNSLGLFAPETTEAPEIRTDAAFCEAAQPGDYCFVEDPALLPREEAIETLILYHWNRDYPADAYFPLSLEHFTLLEQTEFPGRSHERITEEVYHR